MMTAFVTYDHETTHTVVQNNALGEPLGLEPCWELRLPQSGGSGAAVDRLLPARTANFAVLHVNPGLQHKRWTTPGWAAVAAELHRHGLAILLTGNDNQRERAYLQSVRAEMPVPVTDLSGQLHFAEVSELLSRCTLYVGTDTVTTHMAAAAGVPTVALYGPERAKVWGPWPHGFTGPASPWSDGADQQVANVFLLQSDVPCPTCRSGYCLRRSERDRPCNLMQTLDSEKVIRVIRGILQSGATSRAVVTS
jgi:heptosyltransferase-3